MKLFLFSLLQLLSSPRNLHLVCKLKKAIYVTTPDKKQAPRAWKGTPACIKAKIGVEEGAGFQRSQSDHSMFIRRSKPEAPFFWFMWMTLLSLVMNELASINELKKTLRTI